MIINIDRQSNIPIYLQIFEQIRSQIITGVLAPGFRLPPERKLAESLCVNRSTVLNAYRELKAEGLVGSKVGNGTVVLPYLREEEKAESMYTQEPAWNQIFSQYSRNLDSLIVQDLLTLASRNDIISFATGIASPKSGPVEAFREFESEIVEKRNYRPLLHTPTEGFSSLREAVCGLMYRRGVYCSIDEMMILSGSQQGIDLAARILVDPGDIVVVEEPTFFPAIQVFQAAGARIMGVPVDEKGMRIDLLEQLLQRYRPKLIYMVPTFQNPSGTELAIERRRHLVELACKYKVMILEDDAYGDLCFEGNPMPTLKSMDNSGYVIYLSTFSKNIYSGLRLGWMVAHKKIVKRFAAAKQIIDLHSNSLSQWIVERYISSGGLEKHVPKICEEYRLRRDIMYNALQKYAPDGTTWNRPRGGYYIWCRLPEGVSSAKLIPVAARRNVVFVPGTPFYCDGQGDEHIRLNYTFVDIDKIEPGIKGLCEAIKELMEAHEKEAERAAVLEINPIV